MRNVALTEAPGEAVRGHLGQEMLGLCGCHARDPTKLRWAFASVVPRTQLKFKKLHRTSFLDDHPCGQTVWFANAPQEYVCDEDCNPELMLVWTRC